MDFETISRRESRKRRRLSERRRLFNNNNNNSSSNYSSGARQLGHLSQMSFSNNHNDTSGGSGGGYGSGESPAARSESPVCFGDQQKISMKIQFHITVAPENEPLIFDAAAAALQQESDSPNTTTTTKSPPQTPTIGEQIQEKLNLSRQNSTNSQHNDSTRRRQQRLLAMHNSAATTSSGVGNSGGSSLVETPLSQTIDDPMVEVAQSDDSIVRQLAVGNDSPLARMPPMSGGGFISHQREAGARSSTISGGMADEATVRFLQRTGDHQRQQQAQIGSGPQRYNSAANLSSASSGPMDRERIYFKRDGQRFGHEFTLKLAVERTYRCLLKVRPLIPLQSISIQGHQLLFVDCSHQQQHTGGGSGGGGGGGSAPNSTAGSQVALNQRLRSGSAVMAAVPSRHSSQPVNDAYLTKHHLPRNQHHHNHHHQQPHGHQNHNHHHHHNHQANHNNHPRSHPISHHPNRPGLYHAQTTGSLYRASLDQTTTPSAVSSRLQLQLAESTLLYRQQQNQMMRHFAASYCSSSNSHLGNQLIYMFDWPASRFEVNKNKARTEVQTVLKFKNGQILSLPLQVKFYQSDCRQHLEWGSQLHFIDYDCQINQLGQISVDRIQYY